MCISDPTPETTRSIVLLRLSNTKPNGTLKTPPKSIQVNSLAEIPDCVKIKQLQMKLMSTAATEIKLLSAFHRSVNRVITTALASGTTRISHGRIIFGPLNTRKDAKLFRGGDQRLHGFCAGGVRIPVLGNDQS